MDAMNTAWPLAEGKLARIIFKWARGSYLLMYGGKPEAEVVKSIVQKFPIVWSQMLTRKEHNWILVVCPAISKALPKDVKAHVSSVYLMDSFDTEIHKFLRLLVELAILFKMHCVRPGAEYKLLEDQLSTCPLDLGATDPDACGQLNLWKLDVQEMMNLPIPQHVRSYTYANIIAAVCAVIKLQIVDAIPMHLSTHITNWWFKYNLDEVSYMRGIQFWEHTFAMLGTVLRHYMQHLRNHPNERPALSGRAQGNRKNKNDIKIF